MSDLISRQAAIDCEYQVKIINDIEYVMLSEVQMKMRKLPSTQPKREKCRNCKYCTVDDDTGYAYCYAWRRGTQVDWYCSRGKQDE